MKPGDETDAQELAMLVRRLDRQRRARQAADAISEHATGTLYDKHQHIKLLQAVAVAANESPSLDDALQAAVDQICTNFGWPVGHAYLAIGTTSILTLSDIWFIEDLARFESFRRAVETTLIAPTGGVAGLALERRKAVSTGELRTVLPLPLAIAAEACGLRHAFAFPVIGIDAPIAVMEFFTPTEIASDEMLLDVISKIGDLLGKVHVRTRAHATLTSSAEQYRLLFAGNPHPMFIHDADTMELIAVNDAAITEYGYSREELLRMQASDLLSAESRAGGLPREGAARFVRRDGVVIDVEVRGYDIRLPGRRGRMAMAVSADAQRRTAEALRESERRFREMLDTIELLAVLVDVVGTVTYANPYLAKVTGFTKDEVIGKNFFETFLPEERRTDGAREFATNIGRGVIAAHDEMEIVTRLGEQRIILWNSTILRSPQGSILGIASIGSDVTEQRVAEKQLLYNAFHDSLTSLPNRALFLDRVAHALKALKRDGTQSFAVLLLDIDHFKNVNDSLGHVAGDNLLVQIGERLTRCVRAADTVARFGGDEFTVLIERVTDAADATRTSARIQEELAEPFRIDESEIFTSASIGIIVAGPDYEAAEQIVRDADTAMYRAKAQGRARSEIFDARMRSEAVARLRLETDLRRAIERDELTVFYQPIVRLDDAEIMGYEALVRWKHPTKGFVSPAEFIPVAEETSLINVIGQYVLSESCRDASKWAPRYVSVNISGRHFAQGNVVEDVRNALAQCGLPAGTMQIEVTETILMLQPEAALASMNQLRAIGCRIALDDFGTGFSSLGYLHRFPIDRLKIDMSFIRQATEKKNVEIIRSIIALGQGLGLEVVAEGIETTEQRDLLLSLGCHYGQGYLFARPAPFDQVMKSLGS